MSNQETIFQSCVSTRPLPENFDAADLMLFQHELKKPIFSTRLLHFENVNVTSGGLLFRGASNVLPESFSPSRFIDAQLKPKARLKFFVKNRLLKPRRKIDQNVFWITDSWSHEYFHWMTEALPRAFAVRDDLKGATLLLPGAFEKKEYVKSSLKPFGIGNIEFVCDTFFCKSLTMPTQTAPSGNYNDGVIAGFSDFLIDFYQPAASDFTGDKIYISRGKAPKRKIINEDECAVVLKNYGFQTVYFEDYPFERQAKIALNARYLISNHGAGLTNMLFMPEGGSILELRKTADAHNNCYFSLASALRLKYFYQLCDSDNPDENPQTANTFVDCQTLRKNIEQMLAH